MHLIVEGAEPGLMHMGVDLGGADICVAQHGLDGTEVGTVIQKMGGKGMP